MPVRRDWATTLRPASFRGVPFEVDDDDIRDLLRQAVHEIPNGRWTIERLGQGATEISLKGFVAGDTVDLKQSAIGAAFKDDRPGLLILPMLGPMQVAPIELDRSRRGSEHGKVGVSMRFVLKPSPVLGISPAFLANGIFAAAATLIGAVVGQVAGLVRTAGQPSHVVAAAVDGYSTALSALESVRRSARSSASAEIAVTTTALSYRLAEVARDASRAAVLRDLADAAVALGFGMTAESAVESFGPLRAIAAPARTSAAASAVTASTNAGAMASFARIVALAIEGEALARQDFIDRDAADASRSAFSGRIEAETESLAATIRQAQTTRSAADSAISAMSELQRAVIDYLNTVSLDLAPRVTVESNASLPSRVWAWQLYADPSRARELSRGNRVSRPAFMPLRFRALAPATLTVGDP